MTMPKDFYSSEASITYGHGRLCVENKKTGKKIYARSSWDLHSSDNMGLIWTMLKRELQEVSEDDILVQIDLNEERRGEFISFFLAGIPTEELEAELEARKNDGPSPVFSTYKELLKTMLKEAGLPSYETLLRHKRTESSNKDAHSASLS